MDECCLQQQMSTVRILRTRNIFTEENSVKILQTYFLVFFHDYNLK